MEEQLTRFPAQFSWEPVVEHEERLTSHTSYVLCGMGGSHLGARLLLRHDATLPLFIHNDYGLPQLPAHSLSTTLIIVSSYSGNTEEALDSAHVALEAGLPLAVMTSGGALLSFAREHSLPTIVLPTEDIEPRMTIGYALRGIARLLEQPTLEKKLSVIGNELSLSDLKERADALVPALRHHIPLWYTSTQNHPLAYHLKATMNETAKVPSFVSVVPELCHNELSGFDVGESERTLLQSLHPVFLEDSDDDVRVTKRMHLLRDVLKERSVASSVLSIQGSSPLVKGCATIVTGTYLALALAEAYGVPNADTPLITEFKKRMADV